MDKICWDYDDKLDQMYIDSLLEPLAYTQCCDNSPWFLLGCMLSNGTVFDLLIPTPEDIPMTTITRHSLIPQTFYPNRMPWQIDLAKMTDLQFYLICYKIVSLNEIYRPSRIGLGDNPNLTLVDRRLEYIGYSFEFFHYIKIPSYYPQLYNYRYASRSAIRIDDAIVIELEHL